MARGGAKALTEKIAPNCGISPDNIIFHFDCGVRGRTIINDWMYETRAIYFHWEVDKIGMNIGLKPIPGYT